MPTPTEADLIFSLQANHNFSKTLGELKRSALSIHNRLASIQNDAVFAKQVADAYGRPLIANERCGSWYIDPATKAGSAYFKSTDGHTGVWKFSSRRLNLHLLKVIVANDGCIIVDSTRRGKRMPDALSKTIPIWCAVINRYIFPDEPCYHDLYTPPNIVSQSEHAQISALLPSFVIALQALNLPSQQISKPLRPIWVTPESDLQPTATIFEDFHPVICCTVSRRVVGGEGSEGGYIQGAGDDTENWAHGLQPRVFWENIQALLDTDEGDLPKLIQTLVASAAPNSDQGLRRLKPCEWLCIGPISALPESSDGVIVVLHPEITPVETWQTSETRMDIGVGPHKLGSRNLRSALPYIVDFVTSEARVSEEIIVVCESGTDLSIGVALVILCLLYSDDGVLHRRERTRISKNFVRSRLGWISTLLPDANPSRATLQSVNSFLIERF